MIKLKPLKNRKFLSSLFFFSLFWIWFANYLHTHTHYFFLFFFFCCFSFWALFLLTFAEAAAEVCVLVYLTRFDFQFTNSSFSSSSLQTSSSSTSSSLQTVFRRLSITRNFYFTCHMSFVCLLVFLLCSFWSCDSFGRNFECLHWVELLSMLSLFNCQKQRENSQLCWCLLHFFSFKMKKSRIWKVYRNKSAQII